MEASQSRGWTCVSNVSCIGKWILYHWATWKALKWSYWCPKNCRLKSCKIQINLYFFNIISYQHHKQVVTFMLRMICEEKPVHHATWHTAFYATLIPWASLKTPLRNISNPSVWWAQPWLTKCSLAKDPIAVPAHHVFDPQGKHLVTKCSLAKDPVAVPAHHVFDPQGTFSCKSFFFYFNEEQEGKRD